MAHGKYLMESMGYASICVVSWGQRKRLTYAQDWTRKAHAVATLALAAPRLASENPTMGGVGPTAKGHRNGGPAHNFYFFLCYNRAHSNHLTINATSDLQRRGRAEADDGTMVTGNC